MAAKAPARVALKVDVDTERGTRIGVPALQALLTALGVPATFLFSLGPDHTGRAVTRLFRPGFFRKVSRTSVVRVYGWRTLLSGTLLPAPHIGRRHAGIMRAVHAAGFEVGIHAYDHYRWQDHVRRMARAEVRAEFGRARAEFQRIFGFPARTAGAAGWQATPLTREIYDEAELLYASDTRGDAPFFPRGEAGRRRTLEIPTTLPTFDELLGRPEYPEAAIVPHYLRLVRPGGLAVFTLHAELEGMAYRGLFRRLLLAWQEAGVRFVRLADEARTLLRDPAAIPSRALDLRAIDGRSGLVAAPRAEPSVAAHAPE